MKDVRLFTIADFGEPFASKVYLGLIDKINYKKFPNLKIKFLTNGLLLTPKMWEKLKNIHYAIRYLDISIDAASAGTYEKIRRGGKFKQLLKNLEFFSQLRKKNKIESFAIKFVVSSENFQEMVEFVKLGQRFNCDKVIFRLIIKWNFFTEERYQKLAVHYKNHPNHKEFLETLLHPIFDEKNIVFLGNLNTFRQKPVQRDCLDA